MTSHSAFTRFEAHGSRFDSYVSPSRGSRQLCAWRLTVPPELAGVAHRPDREEVLVGLTGRLHLTIDGVEHSLGQGDVALIAAGAELTVAGGPAGGTAWVTTTPGLRATTADGAVLEPPWAR